MNSKPNNALNQFQIDREKIKDDNKSRVCPNIEMLFQKHDEQYLQTFCEGKAIASFGLDLLLLFLVYTLLRYAFELFVYESWIHYHNGAK